MLEAAFPGASPLAVVALLAVALVGGLVSGAIGPGGVLLIAALYALTDLGPSGVVGATSVLFVGGSVIAAVAYRSSRDVDLRLGVALTAPALPGVWAGSWLNARLPVGAFGALLGLLLAGVGLLLLWDPAADGEGSGDGPGAPAAGVVGGLTGVSGGLFGVGGPAVSVPSLVLLGVPVRTAVGTAQVQAVVLTTSVAATYLARGAVPPATVGAVAVPFLAGIVGGWAVAHRVPARRLRAALGVVLVGVGAWVALG